MAVTEPTGADVNGDDAAFMNPSITPGSFEHNDAIDDDNTAHRLKAVAEHRRRALRQIRSALFVVLVASLTPVYWFLAFAAVERPEGLDKTVAAVLDMAPVWVAFALPTLGLVLTAGFAVWLIVWYRRERDRDWSENSAKADAREPKRSAEGYMNLFRLYARTKRRAFFTISYGVVSAWWSIFGMVVNAVLVPTAPIYGVLFVICALQFAAAVLATYVGYDIGRRYLPGNVMVTRTLILSSLATTSQTPYKTAWEQSQESEAEIIDRKPWWFYSYKKARR